MHRSGGPSELYAQLVDNLNPGVEVDSTLAPLICTGILAEPGTLVEMRHQLERWSARTGLPAPAAADLVLSTYEALANAAEHAYPSGSGPVDWWRRAPPMAGCWSSSATAAAGARRRSTPDSVAAGC